MESQWRQDVATFHRNPQEFQTRRKYDLESGSQRDHQESTKDVSHQDYGYQKGRPVLPRRGNRDVENLV
jgi:hypothetical protein